MSVAKSTIIWGIHPSIHPFVRPSIRISIHPSIHPPTYLPTHPPIHPSTVEDLRSVEHSYKNCSINSVTKHEGSSPSPQKLAIWPYPQLCTNPKPNSVVKYKVVPLLNKVPRHEDVWETGDTAPSTPNLDTRLRWVVSPGLFTPKERATETQWTGGLVKPTDGLDALCRDKKSLPLPGNEPRSSSP